MNKGHLGSRIQPSWGTTGHFHCRTIEVKKVTLSEISQAHKWHGWSPKIPSFQNNNKNRKENQ